MFEIYSFADYIECFPGMAWPPSSRPPATNAGLLICVIGNKMRPVTQILTIQLRYSISRPMYEICSNLTRPRPPQLKRLSQPKEWLIFETNAYSFTSKFSCFNNIKNLKVISGLDSPVTKTSENLTSSTFADTSGGATAEGW